ncbi:hypothetical protein [Candidimonas nitroreducens]|uniref:Uncharacterized protein n=1 Tax=Candidimonas nitroreducens TaxID=683354 RepID=A0A225M2A0_9BURK|nr:hypothetical protein [Candidimonas nitroreducens]OWT55246.1 hypothetical protein CEY11_21285 [Candidimonas nitroreducens]
MKSHNHDPVLVNPVNHTVTIPHWGITLRTLYGAVLAAWPHPAPGELQRYTVLYKGAPIAAINVRQHRKTN